MNLTPPTDNLWKFVTVISLLGLIANWLSINGVFRSLDYDFARISQLEQRSRIEALPLLAKRDALLEQAAKEDNTVKKAQLQHEALEITVSVLTGKIQQEKDELRAKTHANVEQVSGRRMDEHIRLTVVFLLFSVFGSFGWYFQFQKHQDAKVRIAAQLAQLELEKKRAEFGMSMEGKSEQNFVRSKLNWAIFVVTVTTLGLTVLQRWPQLNPFH